MPATTAVSAVPTGSPGVEAQFGAIPSFFLSRAAQGQEGGAGVFQLSALIEPDRWINLPGLFAGARVFGQDNDSPGEPYLGYRRHIGSGISLGGVVYGTAKTTQRQLASYHATRVGAEVMGDATLWEPVSWIALHAQAALAATHLSADGTYCVDAMGIAKDCDTGPGATNTMVDGAVSGTFPTGTGTLALDIGRNSAGIFHSARLALLGSVGEMPLLNNGMQTSTGRYEMLGFSLTLGLGAAK
jgi:hypothetical protein